MKYIIALCGLFVLGCSSTNELSSLKSSLRISGETIVAKQDESLTILKENTTALAAIRDQIDTLKASQTDSETGNGKECDLESDAPQNADTDANESHGSSPGSQPVAVSAVQLFITTADFYCPPCERMKRDIEAGLFSEFEIKYVGPFEGQKAYPATRFRSPESPTGWLAVYGYDDTTLDTIKERSGVVKVVSIPSNNTPPAPLSRPVTSSRNDVHHAGVMSHSDMVALHNQLHGGRGQWSWPGDLSKHLQSVHGVVMTGGEQPVSGSFFPVSRQPAIQSSRSVIRSNTWGQGFFGRSRLISRSPTDSGPCP